MQIVIVFIHSHAYCHCHCILSSITYSLANCHCYNSCPSMKDLARSIDWLKRMNPAVASAQQDEIPRSPAHRFSEDSWHLKRCTTILPLLDCWQLLAMSLAGSPGNAQGCSSGDQEETFQSSVFNQTMNAIATMPPEATTKTMGEAL